MRIPREKWPPFGGFLCRATLGVKVPHQTIPLGGQHERRPKRYLKRRPGIRNKYPGRAWERKVHPPLSSRAPSSHPSRALHPLWSAYRRIFPNRAPVMHTITSAPVTG
ncbi:hypothetical protein TNIN_380721 [Trichonephila inaurata madagascariensis]|uniref:Uncharacterized protein n=1 Tax=Trichonephila inaurata madagascariensis TaxID=2747483 RepID=A0A8X6XGW0_9ARAC|nr:hypothetical protein TNIN_380721 [Trichonephila inaurata madagascariensis]